MTAYWFKPKRYGYGATPITWEGWVVTLGTVVAMVVVSLCLRLTEPHSWALAAVFAFDAGAFRRCSPQDRRRVALAVARPLAGRSDYWSFLEWRFWKSKICTSRSTARKF